MKDLRVYLRGWKAQAVIGVYDWKKDSNKICCLIWENGARQNRVPARRPMTLLKLGL